MTVAGDVYRKERRERIQAKIADGMDPDDAIHEVNLAAELEPVLEVTDFNELFDVVAINDKELKAKVEELGLTRNAPRNGLYFYMPIMANPDNEDDDGVFAERFPHSIYAYPTELMLKTVKECGIIGGAGHFQLSLWESGSDACVFLKYDHIIGGRRLAWVKADTLPQMIILKVDELLEKAENINAELDDMFRDIGIDPDDLPEDLPKEQKQRVNRARTASCVPSGGTSKGEYQVAIPDDVQGVLNDCTFDGDKMYLPDRQLDRKLYQDVKKIAELLGGKWKGGKTQAMVFKGDAESLVASAISTGGVENTKKKHQAFFTPEAIGRRMVQILSVRNNMTILEPSAGDGALLNPLMAVIQDEGLDVQVEICEIQDDLRQKLEDESFAVVGADFLQVPVGGKYDRIIMNPPFTKGQDMEHVKHAYSVLKPGGRIVAIMSCAVMNRTQPKFETFRAWLKGLNATIEEIPAGTFKASGTNIATLMVTIDHKEK